MLSNANLTQIKNLFNKIESNDEFEIMFNNYKPNNKLSSSLFFLPIIFLTINFSSV